MKTLKAYPTSFTVTTKPKKAKAQSFDLPFKFSKQDGMYLAECPKGLWSVYAADAEDVINEAYRYYGQYAQDGEYSAKEPRT